jgi:PPM family protein phosphatase
MQIDYAGLTDIGCRRDENEDTIASWPDAAGLVFAVADGMGGAEAGEFASRLAIDALGAALADAATRRRPPHKRLRTAVQAANLAVHDECLSAPHRRGMRTTLTATAIVDGMLISAHVGDCRLYRLRGGRLTRLTRDHNRAALLVRFGLLRPEAAHRHKTQNRLTRSLGDGPMVRIDLVREPTHSGDVLLQCTDGLYRLVSEGEIIEVLSSLAPETACRTLIQLAAAAGGDDNVSVQIASLAPRAAPCRSDSVLSTMSCA